MQLWAKNIAYEPALWISGRHKKILRKLLRLLLTGEEKHTKNYPEPTIEFMCTLSYKIFFQYIRFQLKTDE